MSPSADQRATSSLPSHQQRRSSSWSHHHYREPSNPFFLSRRVKEQSNLRRNRKSVTFEDTPNNSEIRDNLCSVAKPKTLHIEGISKEAAPGGFRGHTQRGVVQQTNRNQTQSQIWGKDGTEKIVESDAGKTVDPSPNEKITFSVQHKSLPKLNIIAPEQLATPSCKPASLLDDGLLKQRPSRREGTVRRKIMRTVSHEDYLLARGANPRTGVVTPSIHSGSSSIDDQELFKIREMSQNAKWRLKGDQWVSLSLDEPSPLPGPPSELNSSRPGRLLRIPPKLVHGSRAQEGTHVNNFEQRKTDSLTATADNAARLRQTAQKNERAFPNPKGKSSVIRATALPPSSIPSNHDRSGKDTVTRRKPLGAPAYKQSGEKLFQSNDLPEASTETVITKTRPVEQARSSSIPTPRKIRFFRPEDVGKALPALPDLPGPKVNDGGNWKEESQSQSISFLGLRPGDGIKGIQDRTDPNNHSSEKKLPCPPTNDTQFQSHRLGGTNMKASLAMIIPMHTTTLESQRHRAILLSHTERRSSALLRSRPIIPPRHYQLTRGTQVEHGAGHRNALKIPRATDSIPIQPTPQGQTNSINGQMTTRNTGVGARSDAHISQPTITPTTIPTTIPTTTVQTLPEDVLVSSSWREVPSPLRLGRQRVNTASRPAMPERAEGTNNVPQVSRINTSGG
jgi:hypothetical protein